MLSQQSVVCATRARLTLAIPMPTNVVTAVSSQFVKSALNALPATCWLLDRADLIITTATRPSNAIDVDLLALKFKRAFRIVRVVTMLSVLAASQTTE